MSAEAKSSLPRVVVLCGDPGLVRELATPASRRGWQCRAVSSPYEAAAELLAGPREVLVVDLRLLGRRHLRLLEMARSAGAEVLGIGALPAGTGSDELSGVRLVARADITRRVEEAVLHRTAAQAPVADAGTYVPTQGAAETVRAKRQAVPLESAPATGQILTNEELTALLEDEP